MKVTYEQLNTILADKKKSPIQYGQYLDYGDAIILWFYSDSERKKAMELLKKIGVASNKMKRSTTYGASYKYKLEIEEYAGRAREVDDDWELALKQGHPADRAAAKRGEQ